MSASDVCSEEVGGSASKSNDDDVCEVIGKLENMSTNNEGITLVCANCGKEGSDITNTCNKCKSVMYCNAACKKKHRKKHKKECEEHAKRSAEQAAKEHDEKLFKQPLQVEDDCPICFMRLPSLGSGRVYMSCCGKVICRGCVHAFQSRAAKARRSKEDNICPFCRTPPARTNGEMDKRYEKRVELNDPNAIRNLACNYALGRYGLPQNMAKACELWHRAGELGNAAAYCSIGSAYMFGHGVERNKKKAIHYWELAAMGGDSKARNILGLIERKLGNMDGALEHYMIAVKGGDSNSLESIKAMYMDGDTTKEDYTKALRSYQIYLDEIKSDQRDEAAADGNKYYESAF